MLGFLLSALYILTHLILIINKRGRNYYYPPILKMRNLMLPIDFFSCDHNYKFYFISEVHSKMKAFTIPQDPTF